MKLDILVFGSHPDDAELGAGGTIAKEIAYSFQIRNGQERIGRGLDIDDLGGIGNAGFC